VSGERGYRRYRRVTVVGAPLDLCVAAMLVTGCASGDYEPVVQIDDASLLERVDAVEVAVLATGCPTPLPTSADGDLGAVQRRWRQERDGHIDGALGELPRDYYAFFARAISYRVPCALAMGCVEHELLPDGGGVIEIPLTTNAECCLPGDVDREFEDFGCCAQARVRVCGHDGSFPEWRDGWEGCEPDVSDPAMAAECAPGDGDSRTTSTGAREERTCLPDCTWGGWN